MKRTLLLTAVLFANMGVVLAVPAEKGKELVSIDSISLMQQSKEGKLIAEKKLPPVVHEQPEGITFTPDKSLLISNEGDFTRGSIVIHKYQK